MDERVFPLAGDRKHVYSCDRSEGVDLRQEMA